MKVTRITREKLYKREYEKDTIITLGSVGRLGAEPLDGLAEIFSMMIKEGGRGC